MRECIYCGRQLEAGEKCTCAMSEARRRAKDGDTVKEENPKSKKYTKKQEKNRRKEARKENARETRKNTWKPNGAKSDVKGLFRDFKNLFISFIKAPVDTVMNPGEMSKTMIFMFVIIEGIIAGMSLFAVTTGAVRGPIGTLGAMMGFGGMNGYELVRGWILSALSGAVCSVIIFFVYSGVFFLVTKFIFKQFTPYWEFVKRFAFAAIPMTIIGTVGVILGLFSYQTFLILLISGIVGVILITYEILRSVWYSKSPTKIIYTMMLCIFIIVTILTGLLRFA